MKFSEPIAIVGLGGVFPGSPTLDDYWENVARGVDAAREVPDGRWTVSAGDVFDPTPGAPDKVYSTRACFIEGFELDPTGLALEESFLQSLDPMFHLALHAGRQAFESARMGEVDISVTRHKLHQTMSLISRLLGRIARVTSERATTSLVD